MIYLKKNYNLVSLDNLLNFEKKDKPSISITFDDGYKDNLVHALPVLNELNVPATIYVITKFFENDFSIWWCELQDYLWKNLENIKFTYNGKNYDFSGKVSDASIMITKDFTIKNLTSELNHKGLTDGDQFKIKINKYTR